jgi:hypothetical protein
MEFAQQHQASASTFSLATDDFRWLKKLFPYTHILPSFIPCKVESRERGERREQEVDAR